MKYIKHFYYPYNYIEHFDGSINFIFFFGSVMGFEEEQDLFMACFSLSSEWKSKKVIENVDNKVKLVEIDNSLLKTNFFCEFFN